MTNEDIKLDEQEVVDLDDLTPIEAIYELLITSEGRPFSSRRYITFVTYLVVIVVFGFLKVVFPAFAESFTVEEFTNATVNLVIAAIVGYSAQDVVSKFTGK